MLYPYEHNINIQKCMREWGVGLGVGPPVKLKVWYIKQIVTQRPLPVNNNKGAKRQKVFKLSEIIGPGH